VSRRVVAVTVAGGIARTVDAGAPGVVVRVGTGYGPPIELARAPGTGT
jgi:hypothetical protein